MSSSIDIRELQASDYDRWLILWSDYLRFYKSELPPEVTANNWTQIITPGISPYALGAFDDAGTLVGFTHYHFHTSCWTIGPYCYLQDLYVDSSVRGGGFGKALIHGVYDAADKAGAEQVYWLTAEDNDTARRLYDKVGTLTPFIKYKKP
jgi:GNAT superfamily N-acetyltransferase